LAKAAIGVAEGVAADWAASGGPDRQYCSSGERFGFALLLTVVALLRLLSAGSASDSVWVEQPLLADWVGPFSTTMPTETRTRH